ncbi:hypothetical protein [Kordiimonas sp.]|uniref:hypothetical protein n=1 Tax=Kordiimonas sp. TaxID=1970157 RepID=UPI003A9567E0
MNEEPNSTEEAAKGRTERRVKYIGAGLAIGVGVGVALGNVALGIALGLVFGVALSRKGGHAA